MSNTANGNSLILIALIITVLFISGGCLISCFIGKKHKVSKTAKRSILIGVAIVLIVVASFLSVFFISLGDFFSREYLDDIHVPLEDRQAEIIIKEWRWLLGSGEEVYYKDNEKETLLGELTGGDDGFCPFNAGLYSIEVDGNELKIEYSFGSDGIWKTKTFELP